MWRVNSKHFFPKTAQNACSICRWTPRFQISSDSAHIYFAPESFRSVLSCQPPSALQAMPDANGPLAFTLPMYAFPAYALFAVDFRQLHLEVIAWVSPPFRSLFRGHLFQLIWRVQQHAPVLAFHSWPRRRCVLWLICAFFRLELLSLFLWLLVVASSGLVIGLGSR